MKLSTSYLQTLWEIMGGQFVITFQYRFLSISRFVSFQFLPIHKNFTIHIVSHI